MYKLNLIDKASFIIVIIGALNWGIYGLFNMDVVQAIFGGQLQLIARVIYILVGVAGIDMLLFIIKTKKRII